MRDIHPTIAAESRLFRGRQNRIALLAVLSMLLSLLVVFASPAMASSVDNPHHPDHWEAFLADEGFENAACVKIEGESRTNFVADADYTLAVVKKAAGENSQRLYWNVQAGDELAPHETQGDGVGYSYVILCTTGEAAADLLADVSVTGACSENDEFVLTVATVNASLKVDFNADGDFDDEGEIDVADGAYLITASGKIAWKAHADAGAAFAGGTTVESGKAEIIACDIDAAALSIGKSATQNGVPLDESTTAAADEAIVFMVTIENTSSGKIEITALNDDVFGALSGDADCQVGTELEPAASCAFTFEKTFSNDLTTEQLQALLDTPHTNVVTVMGEDLAAEEGVSAEVLAEASLTFSVDVAEVLGLTITAPENTEVEGEELPFTGIETEGLLALALVLIGGGGSLLLRAKPGHEGS